MDFTAILNQVLQGVKSLTPIDYYQPRKQTNAFDQYSCALSEFWADICFKELLSIYSLIPAFITIRCITLGQGHGGINNLKLKLCSLGCKS